MKCEAKHNRDMGMGHLWFNGWGEYHTPLNLQGSTFSQIGIFEDFVDIVSQICCTHMHTCNIQWVWHTYRTCTVLSHCRPLKLAAVSKAMTMYFKDREFLANSAVNPWDTVH